MYQQNPDFEARGEFYCICAHGTMHIYIITYIYIYMFELSEAQRLFWCWDSTSEISDSINSRSMEVQKSGGIGNKDAASIMLLWPKIGVVTIRAPPCLVWGGWGVAQTVRPWESSVSF